MSGLGQEEQRLQADEVEAQAAVRCALRCHRIHGRTADTLKVAELYHNRWQIELFFKWLKQHLKIKKFWGETENAVRIQIYTAITTYCMIAIVQKKMSIERSIYEMLQLVSISLTETICLKDLFAKPNCNIVNELDGSTEPTLF